MSKYLTKLQVKKYFRTFLILSSLTVGKDWVVFFSFVSISSVTVVHVQVTILLISVTGELGIVVMGAGGTVEDVVVVELVDKRFLMRFGGTNATDIVDIRYSPARNHPRRIYEMNKKCAVLMVILMVDSSVANFSF